MLRRLFTILAAASLLFCILACVLWACSYSRHPPAWIYLYTRRSEGAIDIYRGVISFYYLGEKFGTWRILYGLERPTWAHTNGFEWTRRPYSHLLYIRLPIWTLALTASLLPIVSFTRFRRRRIEPTESLCPVCRYDVRATPGRCPECGEEMKTQRCKFAHLLLEPIARCRMSRFGPRLRQLKILEWSVDTS